MFDNLQRKKIWIVSIMVLYFGCKLLIYFWSFLLNEVIWVLSQFFICFWVKKNLFELEKFLIVFQFLN